MDQQISQCIINGWEILVPRVLAIAEEESENASIQAVKYANSGEISDGWKNIM